MATLDTIAVQIPFVNPRNGFITKQWLEIIKTTAVPPVSLTTEVTGTLPVANGGTGAATLTDSGILIGNGTSPIAATAAMTDGQLLVGQTGIDPLPKTVSGDATLAASGALTLVAASVLAKLLTVEGAGSLLDADFLDGISSASFLLIADIDDVPVNGEIAAPISSNWAFDHLAAADPHPGYLTPAEGDAAYSALGHTHAATEVTNFHALIAAHVALRA